MELLRPVSTVAPWVSVVEQHCKEMQKNEQKT